MKVRLLTVVVNWNTRDELRRCLQSFGSARPGGEVVVVDNASADGSAEMVAAEFPSVQLVPSDINLGFAGGINRGLDHAAPEVQYVLVLNPDVEIDPRGIDRLLAFMDATPAAAAVSPLLVGDDGALQAHLYRRFPTASQVVLFWTLLSLLMGRIGALRRRLLEHPLRGSRPVPVDQLPGAAILIRGSALERVGRWDAGYFIWWEDVDWCFRARAAGLELFVLPDVEVRHGGGASFRAWTIETRVFQFYRAFYRFLCKHGLRRLRRRITPILLADLWLKERLLVMRRAVGLPHPGGASDLGPTRRAIREVVARCEAGDLPAFSGVTPTVPSSQSPDAGDRPRSDANRENVQDRAEVDQGGGADGGVDVVVVNWNGRRFLPECLRALRRSDVAVRVFLVDNGSTDGSTEYVSSAHPDVQVISLGENVGYAAGANAGLAAGDAPYVLVMNPDVLLDRAYLSRIVERMEDDRRIGAAQGKLFAVAPDDFHADRVVGCGVLDSAGHAIRRTRMVVDRGQGESDSGGYSQEVSVFSACGAALVLRRQLLADLTRVAAEEGAWFAEDFFAYKEDIDLSWRARLLGWDVRFVPAATAWHVRAWAGRRRPVQSVRGPARRHSWKNHYLLMIRNDRFSDWLRDLPWILGWEMLRIAYALVRDPGRLRGFLELVRTAPAAFRSRQRIQNARRVDPGDFRHWFGSDARPVADDGG